MTPWPSYPRQRPEEGRSSLSSAMRPVAVPMFSSRCFALLIREDSPPEERSKSDRVGPAFHSALLPPAVANNPTEPKNLTQKRDNFSTRYASPFPGGSVGLPGVAAAQCLRVMHGVLLVEMISKAICFWWWLWGGERSGGGGETTCWLQIGAEK